MFIVLVLKALKNFQDDTCKRQYWLLPFQVFEVIFTYYLINFWTFKCGACLLWSQRKLLFLMSKAFQNNDGNKKIEHMYSVF